MRFLVLGVLGRVSVSVRVFSVSLGGVREVSRYVVYCAVRGGKVNEQTAIDGFLSSIA